jgi:hypothetical protein
MSQSALLKQSLTTILSRINYEKKYSLASRYKPYVKLTARTGAAVGVAFRFAHLADLADDKEYKVSNKEKLAYPIYPVIGAVGGVYLGVSSSLDSVRTVTFLFGSGVVGTFAKVLLVGILANDDDADKKEL